MKDLGIRTGSAAAAVPVTVTRDTVYVRTDITDISTDEQPNIYQYHEYQYTPEEYQAAVLVQSAVDQATSGHNSTVLEALADASMEQATIEGNTMAIMEALADMSADSTTTE